MYKSSTIFKSKNMNDKSRGRIKFEITFYYNDHGVIYNWNINVLEAHIKLGSQPTYMTKKGTVYKYREILLKRLGYVQKSTKETVEVITLKGDQLEVINDFFNDRSTYKSTLKTIDSIIRGNNWSGSFSKPNSSNLISEDFESGTVMLLNDLVVFDSRSIKILDIQCEEVEINYLFSLDDQLSQLYDYVNENKDSCDLQHFNKTLNKYKEKYVKTTDEVEEMIRKERAKYSTNIDKFYTDYPFGFTSKEQFVKCHIYEVHSIKDAIMKLRYDSKPWKTLLKHVSNPENFIPLPNEIHRRFDRDLFTYKPDGDIYPLTADGKKYIDNELENKFKKIPKQFLTSSRISYLNNRNENINYMEN